MAGVGAQDGGVVSTVLGGKGEKLVIDAGQHVGAATGNRQCSLSGSDFSSQVGRERIFKAGREATGQQVCKEWALWKQERER